MIKQKWWLRGVVGIVLLASGWGLYVSSKHIDRSRRIQAEVMLLENEAAKIRRENETLSEKIDYFSSDNFREQEAKKKLDLKKADETVVVIKPRPEPLEKETAETMDVSAENRFMDEVPNYKKWWNLFSK